MIQRSLLRQSRVLCSIPPVRRIDQISHSFPQPIRIPLLSARSAPRCYSTTVEAEGASKAETSGAEAASSDAKADDSTSTELESKNREIIELKDKYLRSVADFRNLQERTKRDVESARSFAISRFSKDLIESVDNLDRALTTVPADKLAQTDSNKELVNLYDGLKMTNGILMQTLQKHGLERFDPAENNERFNPNLHEATFQTKVEGKEDGTVFMTQQKGFTLNGRVVRAAKVGVVKNS